MAIALGCRCEPGAIHHVVLSGTQDRFEIVEHRTVKMPVGMTWAATLAWLRREIQETLGRTSPELAGFKAAEATASARKGARERVELEAVLQEATFSAAPSIAIERLVWVSIAKKISFGGKPKDSLDQLEGGSLSGLKPKAMQEAAVAALAELPRT